MRLQVIHHYTKSKELTLTANQVISDQSDVQLIRVVNDANLDLSRSIVSDKFTVHKFGENAAVSATGDDIYGAGGTYPFPTAALALRIKAGGDAADDSTGAGARKVVVEGLDANFEPITSEITTNGASVSSATTELYMRLNRAYVTDCGTYGAANTGEIIIENTSGVTLGDIIAEVGQTESSIYTVRAGYTAYITKMEVEVDSSKTATISMYRRDNADDVSAPFTARRLITKFSGVSGQRTLKFESFIEIPEKTDLWFYGIKDSAGTTPVDVNFDLIIAKN